MAEMRALLKKMPERDERQLVMVMVSSKQRPLTFLECRHNTAKQALALTSSLVRRYYLSTRRQFPSVHSLWGSS